MLIYPFFYNLLKEKSHVLSLAPIFVGWIQKALQEGVPQAVVLYNKSDILNIPMHALFILHQ